MIKCKYTVNGVIDVGMHESIISPEIVFEDCDDVTLLECFSFEKYKKTVLEISERLLKRELKRLPKAMGIDYIDGSARIVSPQYYNYTTDTLWFEIVANNDIGDKEMQAYFDDFFADEFNGVKEFNCAYEIYEWISMNFFFCDFCEGKK